MRNRRFTMIELLVVIAIMIIVAGMVLGTIKYLDQNGYKQVTISRMQKLMTALEQYKADYGYYPIQEETNEDAKLTRAFVEAWRKPGQNKMYMNWFEEAYGARDPSSAEFTTEQKTYCMDGSETKGSDNEARCFYYIYPGQVNTESYDLWAKGLDGLHGNGGSSPTDALTNDENDDIASWKFKQ